MVIDAHLHIQNETRIPEWPYRKHSVFLSQRLSRKIVDIEAEAMDFYHPSVDKTDKIMDKVGVVSFF